MLQPTGLGETILFHYEILSLQHIIPLVDLRATCKISRILFFYRSQTSYTKRQNQSTKIPQCTLQSSNKRTAPVCRDSVDKSEVNSFSISQKSCKASPMKLPVQSKDHKSALQIINQPCKHMQRSVKSLTENYSIKDNQW